MIMTEGLVWNVSSLVREIIGGGKPHRQLDVDNDNAFSMPVGAVALFLK